MMKSKTIIFILFLLNGLGSSAFSGGDIIGNGGGLAEQNLSYAFIHLKNILPLCMESEICLPNSKHREIVKNIISALPQEYLRSQPLRFLSGNKHPEIFYIDDSPRTAVTGSNIGDPIFINTDLIYKSIHGDLQPISISDAIGLLVHELGHHHQIKNHDLLDWIGAQVKAFSLTAMDIIYIDRYLDGYSERPPVITLTAIHNKAFTGDPLHGPESTLLIADEEDLHSLNHFLKSTMSTCPAFRTSPSGQMIGYRFFNIYFDHWYRAKEDQVARHYKFRSQVELYCDDPSDLSYPVRFDASRKLELDLYFYFDLDNEKGPVWILDLTKSKSQLL